LALQFRRHTGHWGDLENPKTYEEKRQFRKIYGNHLFYSRVADKYRVRDYVKEKGCGQYLVPLLGVHEKLKPGFFRDLPDRFVVKPNHGSGWKKLVFDKKEADEKSIVRYINSRLNKKYGARYGEYHYQLIQPRALVEELLLEDAALPWNYNYFCFNGSSGFSHYILVTSPDRKIKGRYHCDWTPWGEGLPEEIEKKYADPPNALEMTEVARRLSEDFDFVRVDLYNVRGKIYFGELTLTPGGRPSKPENDERSRFASRTWELDPDNELLYDRSPWLRIARSR
jgi:hypothetical protein